MGANIEDRPTAYFVTVPRTTCDLHKPHLLEQERPYTIVSRISLSEIDYKNFITDMRADRQFLRDHAHLCAGKIMKCLYICQNKGQDGVLVVPDSQDYSGYVKWAAYITEKAVYAYLYETVAMEDNGV